MATSFTQLHLDERILKALDKMGFTESTPIQSRSLPFSLDGLDVLGKAQTGTGKTAAFLVAIFQDLLSRPIEDSRYAGEARALVIAPTRELVLQIAKDAKKIGEFSGLSIHTLLGGMSLDKQVEVLRSQFVDILIATPGRLLDMCEKREVFLDQLEILVIDEADRMLDMGFIPQVKRIVRLCPEKKSRQTLLFSATFSEDVLRLAEQWMYEPMSIEVEPEQVATASVEQFVYLVSSEDKSSVLIKLLKDQAVNSAIVFVNRRDICRNLFAALKKHRIAVGMLSGEMVQKQRTRTLDAFKNGRLSVLVATDVAGRGIHVDNVSHVINYNLPEEPEDYVHRIGRTGRAGKLGVSISLVCEDDAFRLPSIEQLLDEKITCMSPPPELLQEP